MDPGLSGDPLYNTKGHICPRLATYIHTFICSPTEHLWSPSICQALCKALGLQLRTKDTCLHPRCLQGSISPSWELFFPHLQKALWIYIASRMTGA